MTDIVLAPPHDSTPQFGYCYLLIVRAFRGSKAFYPRQDTKKCLMLVGQATQPIEVDMNGTYEETLKSAGHGTFRVTKDSWSIRYYFPGPDMRYNGTWVTIEGRDIDKYISAYRANWEEYQSLKNQIPPGGSFNKLGLQGMSINVGCGGIYRDGICIDYWHMPINNEKDLNTLLESFEYCKAKAKIIIQWLSKN